MTERELRRFFWRGKWKTFDRLKPVISLFEPIPNTNYRQQAHGQTVNENHIQLLLTCVSFDSSRQQPAKTTKANSCSSAFSASLTSENIDLNRVPQVIHEASCHSGHSCRGLDNGLGLETIPVSLRMPVLKKNPSCFPTATYSLEYELITVACLCAISRHS